MKKVVSFSGIMKWAAGLHFGFWMVFLCAIVVILGPARVTAEPVAMAAFAGVWYLIFRMDEKDGV